MKKSMLALGIVLVMLLAAGCDPAAPGLPENGRQPGEEFTMTRSDVMKMFGIFDRIGETLEKPSKKYISDSSMYIENDFTDGSKYRFESDLFNGTRTESHYEKDGHSMSLVREDYRPDICRWDGKLVDIGHLDVLQNEYLSFINFPKLQGWTISEKRAGMTVFTDAFRFDIHETVEGVEVRTEIRWTSDAMHEIVIGSLITAGNEFIDSVSLDGVPMDADSRDRYSSVFTDFRKQMHSVIEGGEE